MNYDHLQAVWARLGQHPETPARRELTVAASGSATAEGDILLAVDDAGLPHVLFPLRHDAPDFADRRSAGVHLVVRDLEHDGCSARYLDLSARRLHLIRVFGYLADEASASAISTGDSLAACRGALARWRELIDRDAPGVVSAEALRGLFAELWVFRSGLALDPGFAAAWRGHSGHPHDFYRRAVALEVKSTVSLGSWSFRIHGLAQLEPPAQAELYLVALRLILDDASGQAITTVVQDILDAGIDRIQLMSALANVGYHQSDEPHYAAQKFVVAAERTWRVSGAFPRLVRDNLEGRSVPSGVSDLHYSIDVPDSCAPVGLEHVLRQMLT